MAKGIGSLREVTARLLINKLVSDVSEYNRDSSRKTLIALACIGAEKLYRDKGIDLSLFNKRSCANMKLGDGWKKMDLGKMAIKMIQDVTR